MSKSPTLHTSTLRKRVELRPANLCLKFGNQSKSFGWLEQTHSAIRTAVMFLHVRVQACYSQLRQQAYSIYGRGSADAPSVLLPTGSATWTPDSLDGLKASRNPMALSQYDGGPPLRVADRQSEALTLQPPPRVSRLKPFAAPTGSEVAQLFPNQS